MNNSLFMLDFVYDAARYIKKRTIHSNDTVFNQVTEGPGPWVGITLRMPNEIKVKAMTTTDLIRLSPLFFFDFLTLRLCCESEEKEIKPPPPPLPLDPPCCTAILTNFSMDSAHMWRPQ